VPPDFSLNIKLLDPEILPDMDGRPVVLIQQVSVKVKNIGQAMALADR
jgi:hypothetical protein